MELMIIIIAYLFFLNIFHLFPFFSIDREESLQSARPNLDNRATQCATSPLSDAGAVVQESSMPYFFSSGIFLLLFFLILRFY